MRLLLTGLNADRLEPIKLVLSAASIEHRAALGRQGWEIWVEEVDYLRSVSAIEGFLEGEEPEEEAPPAPPQSYLKNLSGIWIALGLLAAHLAASQSADRRALVKSFGAAADRILDGELFRTSTALTLHGNAGHIASNMVGIALFGTAVCSITGRGVGWLLILAGGAAGNLVNAMFFQQDHLSIGASTAVFAAIGVLAGQQLVTKIRLRGHRFRAWLPLGAGLALLGFLGSSQFTDLAAHLWGFICGLLFGAVYGVLVKRRPGRAAQIVSGVASALTLGLSWLGGAAL